MIPRHHGAIGRDGQEELSTFQTWDWWDIPWDPKAPWGYRTGWTRGTKHIPDLGLVGYPMGSQGTMGQWDVPGHPTAKSDNLLLFIDDNLLWLK